MEYALLFILGTVFGSFYNVVIYRLPRNMSLLRPPSFCPSCGSKIRWFDNVPLISYVVLRGKCRDCGARIPLQYPLVELSSGLLMVLTYWVWGLSADFLVYYAFFSSLLILSVIDLKWFLLPDRITIPGMLMGVLTSPFRETITPIGSISGIFLGFFLSLAIYFYYIRIRKVEGLGFGDVKLLGFIGSVTGPYGVLISMFFGSLIALAYASPLIIRNKTIQFAIPFGPFLSLGCFLGVLLKEKVLSFLGF